ncbi:MAG: competence/damage-inducible protein A [Dehalococcoidia bacterium]|nr:competence/damage-inducible protein A [Dehalococcoidia bacterium]
MPKDLTVEIFCIGTELLNGLVQDSNSYWMTKEVALLGCTIRRITVVADDPPDMKHALTGAVDRGTDVVLTSGGLGPTPDDLTVAVVSDLLSVKPVVNEAIVQDLMARRNITDRNQVRPALLAMSKTPEGARAYPNPVGIAPCVHVKIKKTHLFLMPGPPREVQGVFEAHVKPFIQKLSPFKVASHRVVINMLEAEVGPLLQQLILAHPGSYLKGALTQAQRVGDTQHLPVDVVCKGETAEKAQESLAQTLQHFEQLLYQQGKEFILR